MADKGQSNTATSCTLTAGSPEQICEVGEEFTFKVLEDGVERSASGRVTRSVGREVPEELQRMADACLVSSERNDLVFAVETVLRSGSSPKPPADKEPSEASTVQAWRPSQQEESSEARAIGVGPTADLVDVVPVSVVVLSCQQKIVYWNRAALKLARLSEATSPAGMRLCDAFGCIHAAESHTDQRAVQDPCRTCGSRGQMATGRWQFPRSIEGTNALTSILVTALPLESKEGSVVCTLADLTPENQWRAMERQFLHDMLNLAGGVKGCATMLKGDVSDEVALDLTDLLDQSATDLVSELFARQQFLRAAAGELEVNLSSVGTLELARMAAAEYQSRSDCRGRSIVIESCFEDLPVETDPAIFLRVLSSLLKNALMSTSVGDAVTIGCRANGNGVEFSVRDCGVIPLQAQAKVFRPPLLTGDAGRAIRNHTAKLMTERYLGGRIRFESDESGGTCFFIHHPSHSHGTGTTNLD